MRELKLDSRHVYVNPNTNGDQEWEYRTIEEAAVAVADGNMESPSVIYIEPDVYWTKGTMTKCGLVINKEWLTMEGLGKSPMDVVIADARGHMVNAYPEDGSGSSPAQTMIVNGNGFRMVNMTVGNYLNLDLEYPLDASKNVKKKSDVVTQAYALASQGEYDFWTFENCRIVGMLDTLSFRHKRVYFHNSLIEGTKDFIGGGQRAVYEDCVIRIHDTCPMYKGGQVGTLYKNCKFYVDLEDFDILYMTKFGQQLMLDHCQFYGEIKNIEWELETKRDSRCYYRDVTLNDIPFRISAQTPENGIEVLEDVSGIFSVYSLLATPDGWNPGKKEGIPVMPLNLSLKGPAAVFEGEKAAIEVISDIPFDPSAASIRTEGEIDAHFEGQTLMVCGLAKETAKAARVFLTVGSVVGVCTLLSRPKQKMAPGFLQKPVLSKNGNILTVSYALSDDGPDYSRITWKHEDGRILAESHGTPAKTYRMTIGDVSKTVVCEVVPCVLDSAPITVLMETKDLPGDLFGFLVMTDENTNMESASFGPVTDDMISNEDVIWEDMLTFPVTVQEKEKNAFLISTIHPSYEGEEVEHVANWSKGDPKNAWRYSRGRDGGKPFYGLAACERGAAIHYIKGEYTGDMEVKVTFIPDKDTGEGFGSANGQYTEVYIKYDEATKNGYGLRIERNASFACGCIFSLREYKDGVSRKISEGIMSSAYMPPCYITLRAKDGKLTLSAETGWENRPKQAVLKNVTHSVYLEASYLENGYGDAGILTTGTVPIGNRTLVSSIAISYRESF